MLNEFKNTFRGGTRLNRFYVTGNIPFSGTSITRFHVRATQIPQLQTNTLSYDYRGRKAHYPGEKVYSAWSISVLDDTGDGDMWAAFQKWQNQLNIQNTNLVNTSVLNHDPDKFKATWTVNHMNLNGDETQSALLKQMTLYGCWPKVVDPINFNMNRPNTLNSFNVVLIYDYIEIKSVT
jgi:hypothetical protein